MLSSSILCDVLQYYDKDIWYTTDKDTLIVVSIKLHVQGVHDVHDTHAPYVSRVCYTYVTSKHFLMAKVLFK